ncbi:hypothetical protein M378DRAFT_13194 [Amanita muscaria Koide BX008]|uniref:Uncharacterized protein n=1 Tax=Amanita muscaria (strain Koide BX008) TaxID=946122 RepID=A0A0C2SFI7_AMAMK|nr:hypothetical protein M378DRAFT_13194 [Amanita muscaria Koide BX008]
MSKFYVGYLLFVSTGEVNPFDKPINYNITLLARSFPLIEVGFLLGNYSRLIQYFRQTATVEETDLPPLHSQVQYPAMRQTDPNAQVLNLRLTTSNGQSSVLHWIDWISIDVPASSHS